MKNYEDNDFKDTIIEAANKNNLVVFVGAGLSRLCGFPSWDKLATSLIDFCTTDPNCDFNYEQNDMIKIKIKDNKELISIAKDILHNTYGGDDTYFKKIYEIFNINNICDEESIDNKKRIVDSMNILTNRIVTTNVDNLLDENKYVAYDAKSFNDSKKANVHSKILHIHGSILNPSTIVFTNKDYLKRYNEHWFKKAMQDIFINDTEAVILFIGYGLSELQVLDFVVQPDQIEIFKKKRFLLQGYYRSEEKLFDVESKFYEQYGITLISYEKDEKSFRKIIDVLEFLKNEVGLKSNHIANQLEKTIKILNSRPNRISDSTFMNDYKNSSINIKQYIIREMLNKNRSHWIKVLIKDDDFIDFLHQKDNYDKNSTAFNLIHTIIYLFLDYSKNKKTQKIIIDFIFNYVNFLISTCLNNYDYFNNYNLCSIILKLIVSNKKYLCNNKAINFIDLYSKKSSDKSVWVLFLCHDNNVLYDCSLKYCKKIVEIALLTIYKTQNRDYYFGDFVAKYSNLMLNKFPFDVFNTCNVCLKNDIENEYSYFNLSMDTFKEIITSDDNDYDFNYLFLRLMLLCLGKLDDNHLLKLYRKYIHSNNRFYTKMAIYIANVRFDLFKDIFVCELDKLICNRHYYGEIYSYFITHKKEFSQFEIEKIGIIIDKLLYENEFLTKANKYDLFNIFSSLDGDNYCKKMAKIIKNSFSADECENYKHYFTPLERGKSIWTSVLGSSKESKNYKSEILEMNPNNYINLFDNYGKEISIVARNLFSEYEKKHGIFNFIFSNNISNLPKVLIYEMLEYNLKNGESNQTKDLLLKTNEIFSKCRQEDKSELSLKIIRDMFYIYCDRNKNITEEVLYLVNRFIDENINYNSLNCKIGPYKNPDINLLLSNDAFICFYLKIVCLIQLEPQKVKKFLLESWNIDQQNIINLCLCSTLKIYLSINGDSIILDLKNIFLREKKIYDLAVVAYSLCPSYNKKVLDELNNIGVLSYIFNIYNDSNFVSNFAASIIIQYVKSKINENIVFIKMIFESKCCNNALLWLKNLHEIIEYTQEDINQIKNLFEVMLDSALYKRDYSHLICEILNFYKESDLRNYVIKLVNKLSLFGTKPYYCSRIIEVMKKIEFSQIDKKSIIYSFLSNLSDHYFHTDEIVELYNYVDWTTDIKGKELMNILGQSNPELLLVLKK